MKGAGSEKGGWGGVTDPMPFFHLIHQLYHLLDSRKKPVAIDSGVWYGHGE